MDPRTEDQLSREVQQLEGVIQRNRELSMRQGTSQQYNPDIARLESQLEDLKFKLDVKRHDRTRDEYNKRAIRKYDEEHKNDSSCLLF